MVVCGMAPWPRSSLIDFGRNFCARWVDGTERPPGHATKPVGDEGKEEEGSRWTKASLKMNDKGMSKFGIGAFGA